VYPRRHPQLYDVQIDWAITPTSSIAAGGRSSCARPSPAIIRSRRKSVFAKPAPGIQTRSICRKRNSLIDIDRNLSAGLHLTRVSRARISIRICTDTKINAVVKSLGLLIAKKNIR
jgi:hypothetical protein